MFVVVRKVHEQAACEVLAEGFIDEVEAVKAVLEDAKKLGLKYPVWEPDNEGGCACSFNGGAFYHVQFYCDGSPECRCHEPPKVVTIH
jgi:hypothetical protein